MSFTLPDAEPNEQQPYSLVGEAHAKPGMADALESKLLALVAPTRLEKGCVSYHVHRDRSNSDRFVFYEAWASREDLLAHLQQPYIQAFLAEHMNFMTKPMEISWLEMRRPQACLK